MPTILIRTFPALILLFPAFLAAQTAPQAPPAEQQELPTFQVQAEEVVLDVVVRDKKGKPIKDLTPEEIEVTDNGVKQKIVGFRLVEGREAIERGAHTPLDPLRQIRLVTLVFERLDVEPRRRARQAALDLIKAEQAQNVFYSVVAIDNQLLVLQQFTADKEALRRAIEMATSGQYTQYATEHARIREQLRQIAANPQPQIPTAPTAPSGPASPQEMANMGQQAGGAALESKLAEVMMNMLQFDATIAQSEHTRLSIFGLLSLVRGQFSMPGRKTILYFSSGMWVPPHLDEPFRAIISTANRGNVTFYAVDTRGVMTWGQNTSAAFELQQAARQTAEDITRDDGRVSVGAILASDRAEQSMRNNVQLPLRDLSEATGGFLIGDSNDLRTPVRKVSEEINSYYEISYRPAIENYDGKFRPTQVSVSRKDTVVQARTGYFALPAAVVSTSLLPYEIPLLKALSSPSLPKDIEYRAGAVHLKPDAAGSLGSVIVEVPLKNIQFTQAEGRFKARLSLVALFKDQGGQVVQKLTRDLPLAGDAAQVPAIQQGNFIYQEEFRLPPGRFTLETAVIDHEANKVSAKRSSFVVKPRAPGVAMSDLCLVRNYQPNAKDLTPDEPFQFQGGKITPTLSSTVYATKGAQLATFFIIYPDPNMPDKPTAEIEYLVDGQVIARGDVPLPAPDKLGRIPYVMSSPAENLPAGNYQVHVIARQGATMAEQRALITVEAPH